MFVADHKVYLRALDVLGAHSSFVRMRQHETKMVRGLARRRPSHISGYALDEGFYDEFYQAGQVAVELDWANTTETAANLFETTIRHLGGLLSAYDLSGENALLLKAKELGDMLYMAFDTPNGMPGFWIDWNNARAGNQVAGSFDPSASPSSLCLEFTRLAQITREDKYWSVTVDHPPSATPTFGPRKF
ncbi:glycosyl hydrolase family 47 [Diaporthe helianthi]|uniref:alpha-1,2-Mannosidase n=1 Tax=Diaporthe helianthi TaxID=158607 RepID=A0A2P5HFJ2_DIAHE|nr:glycosyl hydrolase family 47 [Diaporthe helianthi]